MSTGILWQEKAMVWAKIAIVVQILSAVGMLATLIIWANQGGDPALPTPSCPHGIYFRQAPEINQKCGLESEELFILNSL